MLGLQPLQPRPLPRAFQFRLRLLRQLQEEAQVAVSRAFLVARLEAHLGGDPTRVRGVAVRFSGMVRLPSRLTVRSHAADATGICFDAVGADGAAVLTDGRVLRA